jgi:hypothetical protein
MNSNIEERAEKDDPSSRDEKYEQTLRTLTEIGQRNPDLRELMDRGCHLIKKLPDLMKGIRESFQRAEEKRRQDDALLRYLIPIYLRHTRSRKLFCKGRMKMRFRNRRVRP